MSCEDRLRRCRFEWRPAGEELVCQHADGVDVGSVIDARIGRCLFR